MRRTFITAAAVGVLIAACSSDPSGTAATTTRVATVGSTTASTAPSTTAPSSTAPSSTAPVTKPADAATDAAVQAAVAGAGERCDPLDTTRCLLPFPSDAYTRADPTSAVTGLRVALPAAGMPMNSKG
ncbi:MAG: hypothetical protein WCI22_13925, partial [Actinomycetota bacterium]